MSCLKCWLVYRKVVIGKRVRRLGRWQFLRYILYADVDLIYAAPDRVDYPSWCTAGMNLARPQKEFAFSMTERELACQKKKL